MWERVWECFDPRDVPDLAVNCCDWGCDGDVGDGDSRGCGDKFPPVRWLFVEITEIILGEYPYGLPAGLAA